MCTDFYPHWIIIIILIRQYAHHFQVNKLGVKTQHTNATYRITAFNLTLIFVHSFQSIMWLYYVVLIQISQVFPYNAYKRYFHKKTSLDNNYNYTVRILFYLREKETKNESVIKTVTHKNIVIIIILFRYQ